MLHSTSAIVIYWHTFVFNHLLVSLWPLSMVPYYCCNYDLFLHSAIGNVITALMKHCKFTMSPLPPSNTADWLFSFTVEHIIRSLKVMHASFFIFRYQIPWMTGLSWFQSNLYFFNLTSGIWQSTVSTLLLHALLSYVAVLYPALYSILYQTRFAK